MAPSRIELWQQFFSPISSTLQAGTEMVTGMGELLQQHHVPCGERELARFRGWEANAGGDYFLIAFDGPAGPSAVG